MAGFLRVLLLVIRYGPAIYTLVKEILELIDKLRGEPSFSEKDAARAQEELDKGVNIYRGRRDRRPLLRLRNKLKARCEGRLCPLR